MHARYYESVLMRFISLDPLLGSPENPQSFNRYAYVLNNPLTFSDPTGQHDTDNMCASIFGCGDLSADNLDAWLAALGVDVQPDGPAFTVNESITVTADALPASTAADVACDAFDGMMFDVFKLSGAGDMFHGMFTGDLVEFGTGYLKAGTLVIPGGEEATAVAEGAEALRASGAVKSAIGATGEIGEAALKELGGESQAFFQTSKGARYVDQFVDGAAHESKVGYQSLTRSIKRQIEKDSELLHTEQVKSVTWHFFDSPVTGKIGPSAPLRQFLEEHGITVVFGK